MREYIDYEFSPLRDKISFEYDVERIIDDWILMGFLVGNDFIPHLPHLHINHDALPLLYRTYMSVLPELGGYINENGYLNLVNFEKYLAKLSAFDREHFNEIFVDLKWFESKVGNKYLNEAAGQAAEEAQNCKKKKSKEFNDALCLGALEKDGAEEDVKRLDEEPEEEDDLFETEFRQYKRSYYMSKMGVEVVSDDFLANQAECYVLAIQWILHYYYHGVQSWSWYYPYHYAPYLSDICNIGQLKLKFDLGRPFMPFEQLLAVLPAASKDLLPQSYQSLMISEDSAIIDYYPQDFKTDLNGKQQEWEAVVLIPFIDEARLLEAMDPCNKRLTEDESERNRHTECLMYWYDKETNYKYNSPWPEKFQSVEFCHARNKTISLDAWHVSMGDNKITKVNKSALYFCGFPTLKHIKHTFSLKKTGVQVFQQSSRGENMILEIVIDEDSEDNEVETVASDVLGKSVFVNWPHLEEARVVAVSDGEMKFYLDESQAPQKLYTSGAAPPTKVVHVGNKERNLWVKEVQGVHEHYQRRKGVIINDTSVVIYAQLLAGRRYQLSQNGDVVLEKQWSKQVLPFVYQAVVKDIIAFESGFSHFKTLGELFSTGSVVFMLGNPYYGCMGEVQDSSDVLSENRIRVLFSITCEPELDALIQNQHKYSVKYNPGYVLASRLGVNGYLVSRFTGSIFIGRGSKRNPHGEQKANVGLNLKFNKKNEEVPGYTKRVGTEWTYSSAVEQLLDEFIERYPELFSYISKNSQDDVFYEDDIWPGDEENGAEKVQEIVSWLRAHPVSLLSRSSCDLQILDSAIVEKIEEEVTKCKTKKSNKKVRVTVKPHLLFRPLEQQFGVIPDRDAEFRLFDRVVNVRESFSVPLGLRGTVIGIKGAERDADVLLEVLFDEEFPGGLNIRCSQSRGYRVPTSALINLSHGIRTENGMQKLTAVVKPQPAINHQGSHPSELSAGGSQKGHLGALNHSPRSLFIPMKHKQDDEFSNVWHSLQGTGKSQYSQSHKFNDQSLPQEKQPGQNMHQYHKSGNTENTSKGQRKKESVRIGKQGFEFHKQENRQLDGTTQNVSAPETHIKLLKRNDPSEAERGNAGTAERKPNREFENLLASLKIGGEEQAQSVPIMEAESTAKEHLSPQSFAMKGTQMLKEILKIDSSDSPDKQNEKDPSAQRKQTKQMAAHMNRPHGAGPPFNAQNPELLRPPLLTQPLATPLVPAVAELCRICSLVGMHPPEFSLLRTPQALTVCQVKLSNGLVLHGPQCHAEHEAKEKAAFYALQRLGSLGANFPLPPPPPLFSNYQPLGANIPAGALPVFPQAAPNIMPSAPHMFGAVSWRPTVPLHNKMYYPGSYPGHMPNAGSHNQFIPLQVTKQRAASNKGGENSSTSSSEQRLVPDVASHPPSESSFVSGTSPQTSQRFMVEKSATPASGGAPRSKSNTGSASKRKPRKLAVNFNVPKATE